MGVKRGSERNRYAGNRSNFAARRTGPGSGVRDVINVSQALLNPRCAPSIPQRPSKSPPYSINTLKRCSDEADGQTGFTEEWEQYLQSIREETAIDRAMPVAEREKRRQWLEAHPLEWIKELFPRFAKYDFAGFQKKAIARIIRQATEGNWYEVLSWARELAKSTTVMFAVMFLALTGRKRNILLTSNSSDNAERLLRVYRAQLEANKRIAFYYGNQRGTKWTEEHFITARGVSFFAVGARQSPRGFKLDEVRPDVILPDDFDTDEECRNPEIIADK